MSEAVAKAGNADLRAERGGGKAMSTSAKKRRKVGGANVARCWQGQRDGGWQENIK